MTRNRSDRIALPIEDRDERDALFGMLLQHDRVLLAVSGGRDSIALLHLAHRWAEEHGAMAPALLVATVDHGLRAAATDEAQYVAATCATLGLPHDVLRVSTTAPQSGVQAWAREARYEALTTYAHAEGCTAIATGHQIEDQAETLLMRLARGSGVDGLAAMSPVSQRGDITLLRPLLSISRDRLTATLDAFEISWADDPSNADPRFERTRYAEHADVLADLGLTPEALGLSAQRLGGVRDVLDWAVHTCLLQMPECEEALTDAAWGTLNRETFDEFPPGLRQRVLARVMEQVSGLQTTPRLDRLESFVERLGSTSDLRDTLGGCLVHANGRTINVFREPGRAGFPVLMLNPGETGRWDGRFDVSIDADLGGRVSVRAYSDPPCGSRSETLSDSPPHLPPAARAAIPALWRDDLLLAVPQIGYFAHGVGAAMQETASGPLQAKSCLSGLKRPPRKAREAES